MKQEKVCPYLSILWMLSCSPSALESVKDQLEGGKNSRGRRSHELPQASVLTPVKSLLLEAAWFCDLPSLNKVETP